MLSKFAVLPSKTSDSGPSKSRPPSVKCLTQSLRNPRPTPLCPFGRSESREILEKGFMSVVQMGNRTFYLFGNGPSILSGQPDPCYAGSPLADQPIRFREIRVFSLVPVTIRGVIPMPHEKYILAWGGMFLAFISYQQFLAGGELCQKNVLSTGRIIVAGRQTGPGRIQLFFNNGTIETLEMKFKKEIKIQKVGVTKKHSLDGAKFTCMTEVEGSVFLGTSFGEVRTLQGIVLSCDKTKGAVKQITGINKHLLVILFQNHPVGLLDTRYHALRSVHEGRFTAMEGVYQRDVFIVGDYDGTLHSFRVNQKRGKMEHLFSSTYKYKDIITILTPFDKENMAVATDIGGAYAISRGNFRNDYVNLEKTVTLKEMGSCYVSAGGDVWFKLQETTLYSCTGSPSINPKWKLEDSGPLRKLKKYCQHDFEAIYAFGKNKIFLYFPATTSTWKLDSKDRVITTVVMAKHYLVIQYGKQLSIYFAVDSGKLNFVGKIILNKMTRITAFARVIMDYRIGLSVVSLKDGRVIYALEDVHLKENSMRGWKTAELTALTKDFVVAMETDEIYLYMFTAKANFKTWLMSCGGHCGESKKGTPAYFEFISTGYYKSLVGNGYQMISIDDNFLLVGYKQNTLTAYLIAEDMAFSVETKGPKSWCYIDICDQVFKVAYSISGIFLERVFAKPQRKSIVLFPHSSVIRCAEVIAVHEGDSTGVVGHVVTGDDKGELWMSTCTQIERRKLLFISEHQLCGAIRAISIHENIVVVGTSTGHLYLFNYTENSLRFVSFVKFDCAIGAQRLLNAIVSVKGIRVFVILDSGAMHLVEITPDLKIKMSEFLSICPSAKNARWIDYALDIEHGWHYFWAVSEEGYLCRTRVEVTTTERVSVLEAASTDRYSLFRISVIRLPFYSKTANFVHMFACSHEGQFMNYVFNDTSKRVFYFIVDQIHSHAIIDVLISIVSKSVFYLSTLDITGLVVIREMIFHKNGMILGRKPRKVFTGVRHPTRMVFLRKAAEILVFGKGMTTTELLVETKNKEPVLRPFVYTPWSPVTVD